MGDEDRYDEGYQDGLDDCECYCDGDWQRGYDEGKDEGEQEGWNDGKRDVVATIKPYLDQLEHDMFWNWVDPKWLERVRMIMRELEHV